MATTGKIVEVLFENAIETYEHQMMLLDLCDFVQPNEVQMQNADNVIWRPVQQHAPVISGWDLTGEEQEIIEETYPAILETPKNDFPQQRADQMRDMRFWERRGKESGKRQATELNKSIATRVAIQGSLFYRSNATSGYNFIAEAQAVMNERQSHHSERCFILNDRDNQTFGGDLAARQTLQGRPEQTWKTGQIGQNIAEFDVYTGSFLPNLTGGATPDTAVNGDQSFAPEAGSVNTSTGVVTNVDYRTATIAVDASANYNVGDKIKFINTATDVYSVGLADKTSTGQAMTFTIVAKPTSTSITVYPKPIAADDSSLTTTEKAYANIDTQILDDAVVRRLNTDATNKTCLFWDKSAVEVIGGTIPANLFAEFDGNKVINETLSNGLEMYMLYDGDIASMNFRFRIFTWYGITIANPSSAGVAVTY